MNHNTKKTNAGGFVLAVEFTIEVAGAHVEEPQDPSTRYQQFPEGSEKSKNSSNRPEIKNGDTPGLD